MPFTLENVACPVGEEAGRRQLGRLRVCYSSLLAVDMSCRGGTGERGCWL